MTTIQSLPKLSLIIATYNAQQVLARCIRSIAGQSYHNWELIVIDGGSTDGTVGIIQSHAEHISYWHSRPDKGIYDAWNQAILHATGDYVCFLGADDALHSPNTLAEIVSSVGNARYDLITSRGQLYNATGFRGPVIGASWANAKLPRRIRVCHPGLFHHRSLFKIHGEFNFEYKIAADLEFLLRLPVDIQSYDFPVVVVDIQDGGVSRKYFWRRIGEYRKIHSASPRVGPFKAWLYWADKAWRRPIALLFGLSH